MRAEAFVSSSPSECVLGDVAMPILVCELRKSFDVFAKGLISKDSRDD